VLHALLPVFLILVLRSVGLAVEEIFFQESDTSLSTF